MMASTIQGISTRHQRVLMLFLLACAGLLGLIPGSAQAAGTSSDYIVLYESSAGLTQKVASEEARGNDVQDVFRSAVKGYVASLDSADVARLRAQDGVLLVEKDKPVEALSAGPRSGLASSWGLDRIDQRTLPLNSQISTSQNGFGVSAYIIDTGIRADHSQFGGRVAVGYDAFGDGQNTNDCNGHGTHVAGTVGGSTYGVAPEVSLIAIRVLNCSGSGSTSGVIAGINWATANHDAGVPAVANMSLGGGYSAALNTATQNAIADGITFAVAAGNENANACNSSPASTPNALTVGSTTSSDARSSFSNWGSCVDIFAPGSAITSAWSSSTTSTATISGTSMASPHVAGAAALLLSSNPSSSPAEVATAMSSAATTGAVTDAATGSPNRLLFTGTSSTPNPTPEPPPAPAPTAPANDNFASAATLSSLAATTGTTVAATRETGEPTHVNSGYGSAKSVWYDWTAPADGELDVKTEGSDFDTLLAAYTGSSISALTVRYASDDVIGGNWSRLIFPVTAGTTYRIVIDGYGGASGSTRLSGTFTAATTPPAGAPAAPTGLVATPGSSSASVAFTPGSDNGAAITNYEYSIDNGSTWAARNPAATSSPISISGLSNGTAYSIKLRALNSVGSGAASSAVSVTPVAPTTPTPAPANDNLASAQTLSSLDDRAGTTVGATHETNEPRHVDSRLGSTASIWYLWTAPEDGSLELKTQGSSYDTLLAVYEGDALASLTVKAANDDVIGGAWSRVRLDVTAGTTYKIAVDGFGGRSGSTVISGAFTATRPTPPPIPEPVAPDTTITESPGSSTTNTRPTFSFISSAEGSDFECQLEGRDWVDCTSPFQPATALASGLHSFAVRATSPDGLTDGTPASVAFTVQAPASDPTTPPILSPGILTPTSTTLSALGRSATLSITCVPASAAASRRSRARVAATDGPCSGRLRLTTNRGSSQKTINLEAAATANVAFPIDARTARTLNAGKAVRATLRLTQGTTTRSVTVTLRKLSASARSRLLGQARK
jgi:subtilisin family serine protease